MNKTTLYWHDYETWGADPSRDRPVQFAGIRTDEELNIIGDPLVIYCKPAPDMLPNPVACLITGITPQKALAEGLVEAEFIAQIHQQLVQPGTCGVGYNTVRFDDEVTRYTLYRNFYDPYEREWKNGNSRWDIIDMLRLTRGLRPEGITWPDYQEGEFKGKPSFRLEHLTAANGVSHESAHDALSDVYATIAMAKIIKERQPKLYDYVYAMRGKRDVLALLDIVAKKPVIHVSSMFASAHMCLALVVPLAVHPTNTNGIICYDLSVDPTPLIELSAEEIQRRLFTATADLPAGIERIPLKTIHINKCPVVATAKLLDDPAAERLLIDKTACEYHYQKLLNAPNLTEKLRQVFLQQEFAPIKDPDRMLYSGGFFSDADKRAMQSIRQTKAELLPQLKLKFADSRLEEMLFRYRARNYPQTLTANEKQSWEEFRYLRLTEDNGEGYLTLEQYHEQIEQLQNDAALADNKRALLEELVTYGDQLL